MSRRGRSGASSARGNGLYDAHSQHAGRHEGEGRTLLMGDVCLSDCWHHLGWGCDDRHPCLGEAAGTLAEGITLLLSTLIA